METDFLASGNHFFLPLLALFLDTASFIFPSSGNVFLNESCIPVSGNGFSG